MKKTKSEVWNGYVLAMLPTMNMAHEEAVQVTAARADALMKALEERFGDQAYDSGPVGVAVPKAPTADEGKRALIMGVLGEEGNEMGMRGPEIARRLRGEMESAEAYEQLEGMVKEGLLALELDRVRDTTFGREQVANVVTYLRLDRVKEVDPEFAAAVEAAGGVLVRPEYDRKKMPAWVRQLLGSIAAVRGGVK